MLYNIYDSLLIEYGTKPKNFFALKKKNFTRLAINKLCGDNIELFAFIENNIIKNISFKGKGCVLAIASTSIMTEIMKKKTIQDALKLFDLFRQYLIATPIKRKKITIEEKKLNILLNENFLPSRIKCITIGWYAFYSILQTVINTDNRT